MATNFYTLKATEGSIIMAQGSFQAAGATTVDASSASGQKVLNVAATTAFSAGCKIKIDSGGGNEEDRIVDTIQIGVSLTVTANLGFTHVSPEPVDVVVQADADFPRNNAIDLNLDTYAQLTAAVPSTNLWIDTGSTLTDVDAFVLRVRDYDTVYNSGLFSLRISTSTDGITYTFSELLSLQILGSGIQTTLMKLVTPITDKRYYFLEIIHTLGDDRLKLSMIALAKSTFIPLNWEIVNTVQPRAYNTRIVTPSGRLKGQRQAGATHLVRTIMFKGLTDAQADLLDTVFDESNGSHLPFVYDGSVGLPLTVDTLLQFDQDQIQRIGMDFDSNDVTIRIQEPMHIKPADTL